MKKTEKELNDLKRRHNTLQAEGKVLWRKMEAMYGELMAIRDVLEREEGDDYDPIPVIFGDGFWIDDEVQP